MIVAELQDGLLYVVGVVRVRRVYEHELPLLCFLGVLAHRRFELSY